MTQAVRFDPESVHLGFVVDKVALGHVFPPSTSVFPCQFHSTGAPLQGKTKKKLIIFITGMHNKPQGCGASVASAAGPFPTKIATYIENKCSLFRTNFLLDFVHRPDKI
jgi:hypothetical protein